MILFLINFVNLLRQLLLLQLRFRIHNRYYCSMTYFQFLATGAGEKD